MAFYVQETSQAMTSRDTLLCVLGVDKWPGMVLLWLVSVLSTADFHPEIVLEAPRCLLRLE